MGEMSDYYKEKLYLKKKILNKFIPLFIKGKTPLPPP